MASTSTLLETLAREVESLSIAVRLLENSTSTPSPEPTAEATTLDFFNDSMLNHGDTAWMLSSVALVLFMTMPGLAIYYAGMLSSKNVLAMVMQIFSITCLITVLWLAFGYSLAFAPTQWHPESNKTINDTLIFGNASRFWLRGLTMTSIHVMLADTIPESVYCAFQLTFAIITPALICGSFADRMKYWSMMLFMGLWHLLVYCPIAHSNWHHNGVMWQFGVLDYAGGNVVHISSGVAGLMAALILGNRKGWKPKTYDSHPPHNILLTYMGMSMLWVGWFGFNAGSATVASNTAGNAMLGTQIATATASLSWMLTETIFRKKPSVLGMVNGAIAGLVVITPACGYIDMTGAFISGLVGGSLCYFGSQLKHYVFQIDDALDAFGVHAIGGMVGGICVGFFASPQVTSLSAAPGGQSVSSFAGVYYANTWTGGHQLARQIVGICYAIAWSAIGSFVILKAIDLTIGLRVSESDEDEGLDSSLHGETIVHPDASAKSFKNPVVIEGMEKVETIQEI